ncbi:hypothetical protein INTERNEXUS_120 [Bacillus phage vB_BspM_Internexus]|nr:hypothetical protein INTERNEXUS_120 [Bacillus phage vB_BspM_Internexus]
MTNNLYQKHNYLNKRISYLKNNIIREYDMTNAGVNILRKNNVITEEEYQHLNSMEKLKKNKTVGLFLKKNPDISEALINEFVLIRKELFEKNNIDDDDILSIKKDAVFIINKKLTNLELNEYYKFQEKNRYISYISIDNKEFYYKSDRTLDIKGYSKEIKEFHKDYLFKDLEELLFLDTHNEENALFEKLIQLKYNFVTRELPYQYYLDLIYGKYLYGILNHMYYLDEITEDLKKYVLINNNLNFLLRVINILLK